MSDTPAETKVPEPQTAEVPVPETGTESSAGGLEERIIEKLKTIYDPEIPVNIYEMGLIYDIQMGEEGHVGIRMTLTSPACPVAGSLPGEVEQKVASVEGVQSAEVELVWDPAWNPNMMSEAAKLELNFL